MMVIFYLDEAIERFKAYQRCIPTLLQADENLGTLNQVQLLCDACRQQSSNINYSPLHLAVESGLKGVMTNIHAYRQIVMEPFVNARDDQGINKFFISNNDFSINLKS